MYVRATPPNVSGASFPRKVFGYNGRNSLVSFALLPGRFFLVPNQHSGGTKSRNRLLPLQSGLVAPHVSGVRTHHTACGALMEPPRSQSRRDHERSETGEGRGGPSIYCRQRALRQYTCPRNRTRAGLRLSGRAFAAVQVLGKHPQFLKTQAPRNSRQGA